VNRKRMTKICFFFETKWKYGNKYRKFCIEREEVQY
jgi:hypothetical protein